MSTTTHQRTVRDSKGRFVKRAAEYVSSKFELGREQFRMLGVSAEQRDLVRLAKEQASIHQRNKDGFAVVLLTSGHFHVTDAACKARALKRRGKAPKVTRHQRNSLNAIKRSFYLVCTKPEASAFARELYASGDLIENCTGSYTPAASL